MKFVKIYVCLNDEFFLCLNTIELKYILAFSKSINIPTLTQLQSNMELYFQCLIIHSLWPVIILLAVYAPYKLVNKMNNSLYNFFVIDPNRN